MEREVVALMLGDVVGEAGVSALEEGLGALITEEGALFVVVNGENAADGFGLSAPLAGRIFAAGADVITGGNHTWEKREFWPYMDANPRVLRPANYPGGLAGRGEALVTKDGVSFLVINLQGREYMSAVDCPFRGFDSVYARAREGAGVNPVVLVDFHAEAVDEKEALGFYLDGRAALIAGTHTHVQTADEKLLPGGSAYMSDLGMTGGAEGIIGMDKPLCLERTLSQVPRALVCARGGRAIEGAAVRIDVTRGTALSVRRIRRVLD